MCVAQKHIGGADRSMRARMLSLRGRCQGKGGIGVACGKGSVGVVAVEVEGVFELLEKVI